MNRLKMPVANIARVAIGLVIVAIGLQVNWSLLPTVWAQDESQAALVIQHGDGSVITQCIRFEGESTTGYNLLVDSELDLSVDLSGLGGAEVMATEKLKATITGVGGIVYAGNPKNIEKQITGFGKIKRAKEYIDDENI
jgi:hypothetical protein